LLTAALFIACSDEPVDPFGAHGSTMNGPAMATLDGRVGSTGNSAKSGSIDARVLLDPSGKAQLEVRTGTFDERTNTGTADGVFQSIQYKVFNGASKQVVVRNV